MDDRIRTSEADREQAAARLREHFAEGRITADELDERIAAVLSARTFGDLRRTMADLPGPVPAPPRPVPPRPGPAPWPARSPAAFRRGPRLLPLMLVLLIAVVVLPHAGWLFFGLLNVLLAFWLVALLAGVVAIARFRRHVRRYWQSGQHGQWQHGQWQHWHQYQWRG
jgi:hypothetical protein